MAHTKKKMTYASGKSSKVGGSRGMVGNTAKKSSTKMTKKKGMRKSSY